MKKFFQKIKEILSKPIIVLIIMCVTFWFLAYTSFSKYSKLKTEYEYTLSEYEQLLFEKQEQNLYTFIGEYSFLKNEKIPTNDSVVYEFIKSTGCWYPDIVMAQYIIETGGGESRLCQEDNNCFGMMRVKSNGRRNTQLPGETVYGRYINWQLSVVDRQLWDFAVFDSSKPTKDYYLYIIRKIYADDREYLNKITEEAKKWTY